MICISGVKAMDDITKDKTEFIRAQDVFKGFTLDTYEGTPLPSEEVVYLFISFDLYEFTLFKTQNKVSWSPAIQLFLNLFDHEFTGVDYWKFNGDELLYKKRVTSLIEIKDIIIKAYRCMELIESSFRSTLKKRIYIKAGAWIANVKDRTNAENDYSDGGIWNYRVFNGGREDFVGINMDEGFRMCACATRSLFLIDPKIAYLFHILNMEISHLRVQEGIVVPVKPEDGSKLFDIHAELSDIRCVDFIRSVKNYALRTMSTRKIAGMRIFVENFAFVGYMMCKGVWNNRPYPIIWYSNDWKKETPQLHYDDVINNKYLSSTILSSTKKKTVTEGQHNLRELRAIFDQVDAIDNFYCIMGLLSADDPSIKKPIYVQPKLNYVVVCVTNNYKVLMFKRANSRGLLKNVWDFGMSRHSTMADISQTIQHDYENNFGVKIQIANDKDRNQQIKPFAFCQIPRHSGIQNVILCFARVVDIVPSIGNEKETPDDIISESVTNAINVEREIPDDIILKAVKSAISAEKEKDLYVDVALVSLDDIHVDEKQFVRINMNGQSVQLDCLDEKEIENDACCFHNHTPQPNMENKATLNAALSIREAIEYYEKVDKATNKFVNKDTYGMQSMNIFSIDTE